MRVQLVLKVQKNAVLVPNAATQISQQGPYVWVVKNDDTTELRPVTLGQQQGELVVVESGVQPGERVITSGQLGVAPGAKVHVQEAAAPASATQPTQTAGGE